MSWWIERLSQVESKYEELGRLLSDPAVHARREDFRRYSKEHADLTPVVRAYRAHSELARQLEGVEGMVRAERDPDLLAMAREEKSQLEGRLAQAEEELKRLLLPRDPLDAKNVLLEVRAGTGGEEASLFAADLARMYTRFAERKGWKVETLNSSPTELGGFREIILLVKGQGAYSQLKFEGGVHRVQRVPETEASGRIHTSAVTVAVMPEAEDVEVEVRAEDLRIDVFRSSGCGGQSVNTTDSAVRMTHIPTGIVVSCQDERSQLKNKYKAMKILRSRLLAREQEERKAREDGARRSMVGSGDRSERIRTYNFPQARLTDHRIGLTLYRLPDIMDGDLDEVTGSLLASHQAEQLKSMEVA